MLLSVSYSNVSHRKARKILVDVLGTTRKVRPSVGGNTCSSPAASATGTLATRV
jgi:hypothetical protein